MEKDIIIHSLFVVYNKMTDFRLSRGLELWPIEDYKELITMLRENDWSAFKEEELLKLEGIASRYFGRGEIALMYCPKMITYEEISAAKNGLHQIMSQIRDKLS